MAYAFPPTTDSLPFPDDVKLSGRPIRTVQDAFKILNETPEENRYNVQLELLSILMRCRTELVEAISALHDDAIASGAWQHDEQTKEEFEREWEDAAEIKDKHRNEARILQVKDKATTQWGAENAEQFFTRVNSRAMADRVSKLLTRRIDYDTVRSTINNAIVARLRRPGQGHRRSKGVLPGDVTKALEEQCTDALDQHVLEELGLRIGDDGFLCEDGAGFNLPRENAASAE